MRDLAHGGVIACGDGGLRRSELLGGVVQKLADDLRQEVSIRTACRHEIGRRVYRRESLSGRRDRALGCAPHPWQDCIDQFRRLERFRDVSVHAGG